MWKARAEEERSKVEAAQARARELVQNALKIDTGVSAAGVLQDTPKMDFVARVSAVEEEMMEETRQVLCALHLCSHTLQTCVYS